MSAIVSTSCSAPSSARPREKSSSDSRCSRRRLRTISTSRRSRGVNASKTLLTRSASTASERKPASRPRISWRLHGKGALLSHDLLHQTDHFRRLDHHFFCQAFHLLAANEFRLQAPLLGFSDEVGAGQSLGIARAQKFNLLRGSTGRGKHRGATEFAGP